LAKRSRPKPLRADLHIHTTASDSRWTPRQVVEGCLAEGIGLLAVTDHDTMDAVLETEALAMEAGIAFLRGVEVSTIVQGLVLHILGYGIDPHDPLLVGVLRDNDRKLRATDDGDIRALIGLGYDIDYDDYLSYTYDRTRGGFKSLNYCIDLGICSDAYDYFGRIRAQLKHTWPDFAHPHEAVRAIRGAGGVPILAHPGASLKDVGGVTEEALASVLDLGIAGIECYSQYHDAPTTTLCVDFCWQHDLLVTGGSDYHGGFVGRQLGVPVIDTAMLRLGELEARIRRAP
jgi:hypothetical protein